MELYSHLTLPEQIGVVWSVWRVLVIDGNKIRYILAVCIHVFTSTGR